LLRGRDARLSPVDSAIRGTAGRSGGADGSVFRLGGWRRAVVPGTLAVVALPLVLVAHSGYVGAHPELASGAAWLASPAQGIVTLLDGAAGQVVGSVRVPGAVAGSALSSVQQGSSAYAVLPAQGTVSRVDGATYAVSRPVQFGGGGSLTVIPGSTTTYIVDGQRRLASAVDPVTLAVRRQLALTSQPGPEQSAVDGAGRLWTVDAHGLSWFDEAGGHTRSEVGDAQSRLVLLGGRAAVVEPDKARVGLLSDSGRVDSWSCLRVGVGDRADLDAVQVIGSASGRVYAAVPATGTLIAAGDGNDDCGGAVGVGQPGDRFGPLVESDGYLFVPNWTTGHTAVVSLTGLRVAADLNVVPARNRVELLAKDGLVFFNNLDGTEAGVLRLDGESWKVGASVKKFSPGNVGAGILTPSPPKGSKTGAGDGGNGRKPNDPKQPRPNDPAHPTDPAHPRDPTDPANPNDPANPPDPNDPANPPGQTDPPDQPDPSNPSDPANPTDPAPEPAVLTVRVTGAGFVTAAAPAPLNGSVGTRCEANSNCTFQYPTGTTAVLEVPAHPSADVLLDHVTGCTTMDVTADSTTCRVGVTTGDTVEAVFVPAPPAKVTLAVSYTAPPDGTLRATPQGGQAVVCDSGCTLQVDPGTVVDLATHLGADEVVDDWGVAGCPERTLTCTVQVAADRSVAVHAIPPQELDITVVGQGTVGGDVSCPGNPCQAFVQFGRSAALQAFPAGGAVFVSWQGCTPDAGTPQICRLTMPHGPVAVRATFRTLDTTPPVVTITDGRGHTVTGNSGDVSVTLPDFAPYTITASATDPQSAVTSIVLKRQIAFNCSVNTGGGRTPTPIADSTGAPISNTLDVRDFCGADDASRGISAIWVATATSEGGSSEDTSQFLASHFQ
jgi:Divergent InlB B-repeat domain